MDENRHVVRRWNMFAAELDALLTAKGLGLGHLDDRAHIHREKVRRLQRSLREPKFHVLAPEELEYVCDVFGFSHEQRLRLRAAVLCTAVEELLMDRINQDEALAAAEQLLPLFYRALARHADEDRGLGAVKGAVSVVKAFSPVSPVSPVGVAEDNATAAARKADLVLEPALRYIDAALLALYLSQDSYERTARSRYARQAKDLCTSALAELEAAPLVLRDGNLWRLWHADTLNILASAERAIAANS